MNIHSRNLSAKKQLKP